MSSQGGSPGAPVGGSPAGDADQPQPAVNGVRAAIFAGTELRGAPLLERIDPNIDFDLGHGPVGEGLPADNYSIRWDTILVPRIGGEIRIVTFSDDGIRVLLDGRPVISAWYDHGREEHSGTVTLEAGRAYQLRVEFYERGGGAEARLLWEGPGVPRQPIPAEVLFLADPGAQPAPVGVRLEAEAGPADDEPRVAVNGENRVALAYNQASGAVDLSPFLTSPLNVIDLINFNIGGGWVNRFLLRLDGQTILDDACGAAGQRSCDDRDATIGRKYYRRVLIRADGSYTAVDLSPANAVTAAGQAAAFAATVKGRTGPVSWTATDQAGNATPLPGGTFTPPAPGAWQVCAEADTGEASRAAACAPVLATGSQAASHTLAVARRGGGQGGVSSAPSGISCPDTCAADFPAGARVTLTAAPAAGSTFAGWGGACGGTGNCTLDMDAAKEVTAAFEAAPAAGVTGVTLTADRSAVHSGGEVGLKASADGAGVADRSVRWEVRAGDAWFISSDGAGARLQTRQGLRQDETAVIRATSNADPAKYAEVAVSVYAQIQITGLRTTQVSPGEPRVRVEWDLFVPVPGAALECILDPGDLLPSTGWVPCTDRRSFEYRYPAWGGRRARLDVRVTDPSNKRQAGEYVSFTLAEGAGGTPSACPAEPAPPSDYALAESGKGVKVYRNGATYVLRVELCRGATLRTQTNAMVSANPEKFQVTSLQDHWGRLGSRAFAVANAQFFGFPDSPAGISFAVKSNGAVVTQGGDLRKVFPGYVYGGKAMLFDFSDTRASVFPIEVRDGVLPLTSSREPHALMGIHDSGWSDSNERTAVGATGDGKVAFILVTGTSMQTSAASAILRSFGASGTMQLDGGGSSQLIVKGSSRIYSARQIPNVLAVFEAP